jgi:hypothetical protein
VSQMPARARVNAVAHVTGAAPAGLAAVPTAADSHLLKVAPMVQSVRDQDRKRILEDELSQEQARLALTSKKIKQSQAKLPAVELALLSQSSARSESNVQALQRELSRLSR